MTQQFDMSRATVRNAAPIARFGITFNGAPIPWVEHVSERNARKAIEWMARMMGSDKRRFDVVVAPCGECHETDCLCLEER